MIAMRDYVASINDTNTRVVQAMGKVALNVAERVSALNVDTWRATVQESAANMQALMGAKNARELVRIEGALARLGLGKLISFYRHGYEILAATKKELLNTLGAEFAGLNRSTTALLEQTGAPMPAGCAAAAQSAASAVNAVVEGVDTAVAQAVEMAEAKLMASVDADVKVVHVGLPRQKPKRRHDVEDASLLATSARAGATRKRALGGG